MISNLMLIYDRAEWSNVFLLSTLIAFMVNIGKKQVTSIRRRVGVLVTCVFSPILATCQPEIDVDIRCVSCPCWGVLLRQKSNLCFVGYFTDYACNRLQKAEVYTNFASR